MKGSRQALATSILILLLGLTGCLSPGVVDATQVNSSPTLTATPTISPIWFPPTSTPTYTQVATRAPQTPTPDLRPTVGAILFSDDFTDRKTWTTGRFDAGSISYGKSELTLAVSTPKGSLTSLRAQTLLGDFYLEMDVALTLCQDSDTYGILFRMASSQDFYRFIQTCNGRMRLERVKDSQANVIQDWTPVTQVPAGPPVTYHLGIWASGKVLRFYLNGVPQFTRTDPVFSEGGLGVLVRSAGENVVTVSFSNLAVHLTSGSTPVSTPTVRKTASPKP